MTNFIYECITLLPILVLGMLLGTVYFWILWFSVRRGLISPHPVRWFFSALILRMSMVLSSFYFIANGDWQTLVICLLGFVIARELVSRLVVFKSIFSHNLLKAEQHNAP